MRVLVALALLCVAQSGYAADCGAITGWVGIPVCSYAGTVSVPNVVGEASSAAADAILEGVGLDLDQVIEQCSAVTDDEVIAQAPPAGTSVSVGSLVDVTVSTGAACTNSGGNGVRIRGLRIPGL